MPDQSVAPSAPNWTVPFLNHLGGFVLLLFLAGVFGFMVLDVRRESPAPYGIRTRVPWTTSRVVGTPEPPPPYRTERVFPKLKFNHPVLFATAPGSARFFVAEQDGKIFSFPNDPACEQPDLFIDVKEEGTKVDKGEKGESIGAVYGLAFHPEFEKNRYCYICYVYSNKTGEQLPDGTRVSRFRVTDSNPPRCDPESEQVIISWLGGGHNGGCLEFGPDGCLYISSGDGSFPNPPDARHSGQDMSTLLSAILRIDVDDPSGDQLYTIPRDNPFVELADARGEIWAFGFRNPWKITFDRGTGDLWAGDVGWELWEMVDRIEKGGNYGWSITEGNQSVYPEGKRGPTPILPPTIEIPHSEGASVTGGYVYRGKKLKDLGGAYVFGDWETHRMWAARFDGTKMGPRQELVEPELRIVAFGEDRDGELYVLDYDQGTLHQLVASETVAKPPEFPTLISQTGLFASTANHTPAPGVLGFSINAEQWADHAIAERFIALPENSSIKVNKVPVAIPGTIFNRDLEFPENAVLIKTLALEMDRGNPASRRRLETQLLHFNGKTWRGYTYEWNDTQTDAALVPATGVDRTYTITDQEAPGGKRTQAWNFAGRAQCVRCHNPWSQHTLAFNLPQLNKPHFFGEAWDNQLRTLEHLGVLENAKSDAASLVPLNSANRKLPKLTNPYQITADLNARARSYLHANCAHCHQFGAGGTADIELRYNIALDKTKCVGIRPMQGTFGIHDARILASGDPFHSVLFYRLAKLGKGRMPHVGSEIIDEPALEMFQAWIDQILPKPSKPASGGSDDLARIHELRDNVANAKNRTETISYLLADTSRALRLARTIEQRGLPEPVQAEIVTTAAASPEVQVRDLFEQFLPEEKRAKRLGSVVDPAKLLAMPGDAARGKNLFLNTAGISCKNCHRIGSDGSKLGPELTQIGKKYNRGQILESLLEPSKFIDPKFVTYLVETTKGTVHTGLLVERTGDAVILRDSQDKELRIPTSEVEQLVTQRQSLMPELLLRDLTAEQVADLLAYLESLK